MGRPIGSLNREKPFNQALLMTLRSNPVALRRIAAKLIEKKAAPFSLLILNQNRIWNYG